jgi:hypothetical protein
MPLYEPKKLPVLQKAPAERPREAAKKSEDILERIMAKQGPGLQVQTYCSPEFEGSSSSIDEVHNELKRVRDSVQK